MVATPHALTLDLTEHHTPALAKLICQVSTNAGDSSQKASAILTILAARQAKALRRPKVS